MALEYLEEIQFFGSKLVNFSDFGEMLFRLGLDLIVVFIILRLIYYPIYKERNYVFTSVIVNLAVFFICFLLSGVKLKIGFAFGLFAVFSILRYRTEQIPIRHMTYLFVSIILGVINSIYNKKISHVEVFFANTVIVLVILLLEKKFIQQDGLLRITRYEKIDLIKPENHAELLADLRERTGLNVYEVQVERVNFLNDTARLNVFYRKTNNLTPE
jgi:hypothetical protein